MRASSKDKKVIFSCIAADAKQVSIAGTFNQWSTHAMPLKRGRLGKWTIKIALPAGYYEYKFVIDNKWCCDPGCPGCETVNEICKNCVTNSFGSMNRTIVIE